LQRLQQELRGLGSSGRERPRSWVSEGRNEKALVPQEMVNASGKSEKEGCSSTLEMKISPPSPNAEPGWVRENEA
jgi:hypothetical protein